jgi:hypothetical protein
MRFSLSILMAHRLSDGGPWATDLAITNRFTGARSNPVLSGPNRASVAMRCSFWFLAVWLHYR